MFKINNTYSKNDIYNILNVPNNKRKGNWNTGYTTYNDNIYIFANIGIPGRTGHDYANSENGDLFNWEAKNNTKVSQSAIQRMLNPGLNKILLFTRKNNRDPFTFRGYIKAKKYFDTTPVKIIWEFIDNK